MKWKSSLNDIKLDNEDNKKHIIVAKDISYGPKTFCCMEYQRFFKLIKEVPIEHRLYNEIIRNDYPVKFFLDIEGMLEYNEFLRDRKEVIDYIKNTILKTAIEMIKESNKIEVNEEDFIYLDSSNKEKLSLHVITTNEDFIFNDKRMLSDFVDDLCNNIINSCIRNKTKNHLIINKKEKNGYIKETVLIDRRAPVGMGLRICYCQKYKSNRFLYPYDTSKNSLVTNIEEEILKKSLLHYFEKEDNFIKYSKKYTKLEMKNDETNFNALRRMDNSICDINISSNDIKTICKEIIENYLKGLGVEEDVKIVRDIKTNTEKNVLKVELCKTNHCIIKRKLGENNDASIYHTKPSGYYYIISLKYKNIKPSCFHDTCSSKDVWYWTVQNLTSRLNDYTIDILKKIVDNTELSIINKRKRKGGNDENKEPKKQKIDFGFDTCDLEQIDGLEF